MQTTRRAMAVLVLAGFSAFLGGSPFAARAGGEEPAPARRPKARPTPAAKATTPRQLRVATSDEGGFERLGDPQPGDWLSTQEEPGQTFKQYVRVDPVRAEGDRRVLAFLPVGKFDAEQWKVAKAATRFAGIWFDLEPHVLERKPLPSKAWQREGTFPWRKDKVLQYHTRYFLERLLPRHLPDDAVTLIGVTMGDLYPHPSWNYVFGQANLRRRVGVYSLARYFETFWGKEETAAGRIQALRRSLKLVTHESGHTFGMEHCVYFACNMNGSMSLRESDSRPLRLCPVCLKKLQWNRNFDVLARYRKLAAFFGKHRLDAERRWTLSRIRRIETTR